MNQSEPKKIEKDVPSSKKMTVMMMLKERIELECGREIKTPKDYDLLALLIYQKTHCNISVSTLKRFMGYVRTYTHTSASTLNILARYVGFLDFEDFQNSLSYQTNESKTMSKKELTQFLQHLRLQATYLCEQIIRLEEQLG